MAVVALTAIATAILARQFEELQSLIALEIGALQPHAPVADHPYARLLRATLKDFREMDPGTVWSWAVACIAPLDEARREQDRPWEWLIVAELDAACRFIQKSVRASGIG